jgi:ABC-type amino acid transport substrate-binding protein
MSDQVNEDKRGFLKAASLTALAAGAAALATGMNVREAAAQAIAEAGDENSVLAKVVSEGKLVIGYAQTLPWFQLNPSSGQLEGIYYDACMQLCLEMNVEPVFVETSFANATLELRQGNFDLFGSSLSYTAARAITAAYVGPLWRKGVILGVRKEDADRFASLDQLNSPDITFSVTSGTREESTVKFYFPNAQVISTQGQWMMGAEPVRAGRADVWLTGDSDGQSFAKRNDWVHFINLNDPIDRRPNTWAVRYGDPTWKAFLDMFGDALVASGFMQARYNHHMAA